LHSKENVKNDSDSSSDVDVVLAYYLPLGALGLYCAVIHVLISGFFGTI